MAFSPRASSSSSRGRHGRRSDLYSTVVIHGDDDGGSESDAAAGDDDEEEEASSLPPLLQRVPKDFGAAVDDDDDDEGEDYSGTFIVKRDARPSPSPTARRTLRSPFLDLKRASPRSRGGQQDDPYSTFLIHSTSRGSSLSESASGTVVRRTGGGGGGFGSPFTSGAVEELRMGEAGGGFRQSQWEEVKQQHQQQQQQQQQQPQRRKASVSSVPDNVAREDPSSKYELLHELELVAVKVISLTEGVYPFLRAT
ncbi:hypothetical protein BHE74_00054859 [Ensete ventricosum]|nr:hypothetical protein BHE74_00054859 [Ensete ventricosum]